MDLTYLFFMSLAAIAIPILGIMLVRAVLKKKPYKFKMIFRTPGLDKQVTVYEDTLDCIIKVGETEYTIKPERLYRLKPGLFSKILNKLRGIKQNFIVVYQEEKTEPVSPGTVDVSARILKEVSESRALDKALRSEFKVPWDMKKILMVIGFLVVAVVVWVVISGEVSL